MSKNLSDYIKKAMVTLLAEREVGKEIIYTRNQIETQWRQFVLDEIGAGLPEVLRPFLKWGSEDEDDKSVTLRLEIPECTGIDVVVFAQRGYEDVKRSAKLSKRKWSDGSFEVLKFECKKNYDDAEYCIHATVIKQTDDISRAVALAHEIGEHWTDERLLMDEKNAALKLEQAEAARVRVCPLLSTDEGHEKCLRDKCAFFVMWKGENTCAIKTIGDAALDMLPVE